MFSTESAFVAPRDIVELQLTKILSEILEIQPIGVRDNFFDDLGGNSMLTVRLSRQIEKRFGKALPLVTLLEVATVEQLASLLRQSEWPMPWSSLVAIQPAGSKPPFFCIGGAGGDTFYFHNLSNHLGLDQPVYGLQAQGLDGKQAPHTRIEDMAAHYIKEMRTLQPEGPYLLGGHSAGGVVAFEMAQQLQIQGQKVDLLALFDPSTPEVMNYIPPFRDKASSVLINLIEFEPKKKLTYVLRSLEYHVKNIGKKIASRVSLLSLHPLPQDLGGPEFLTREIRLMFKVQEQAVRDYLPKVYQGPITLFKATDQPILNATELAISRRYPLLGWDKLAAGAVEVHEVPGNHAFEGSLLSEPHVRVLAEKLKVCLDGVHVARNF